MKVLNHLELTLIELQALSGRELNKLLLERGFRFTAQEPKVQFMLPFISGLAADTTFFCENGAVTFYQEKLDASQEVGDA